jgi:two-component system sensor histidine kinase SenX3
VLQRDRRPRELSSPERGAAGIPSFLGADHELARGLVESVSHHLRTPLTVVSGYAELLIDDECELPAQIHQSLACVLRAGRRLEDVVAGICDLIDLSCVDPNAVKALDVSELVADEVAMYRDRAVQRGIRLRTGGDPVANCVVDSRGLRRALRELLDNALTYAPRQSTVRAVTTVAATGIRIIVSDHGDGIDSADRERLTRPFERGIHPRQPAAGRGMGLALASVVAASHRGRLILTECAGGGLQACLELPVDFTHLTDAPATTWARAAGARGTAARSCVSTCQGEGA